MLGALGAWSTAEVLGAQPRGRWRAALAAALVASGAAGLGFERVIIRRVYGAHLRQILITVGGLIIAEQLMIAVWGAAAAAAGRSPPRLRGSIILAGAAIEKYRLIAVALGLPSMPDCI